MKSVTLPDGTAVPALGQGTWHMGEGGRREAEEVAALRLGISLGMTLIDTAEMYGNGGAEEVVGKAIAGQRDRVFIVSKVYPHNASREGVAAACARSLKRLGTDRIDLYLLHWRGGHPLSETVEGFERLREAGMIRLWGVSNLDLADMKEIAALPHGAHCATDQVLYNAEIRGIEFDLLPWCRTRRMPIMAYSPVGQGGKLLRSPALTAVAQRHHVTPGASGHRLEFAGRRCDLDPEGERPRACAPERGGRRSGTRARTILLRSMHNIHRRSASSHSGFCRKAPRLCIGAGRSASALGVGRSLLMRAGLVGHVMDGLLVVLDRRGVGGRSAGSGLRRRGGGVVGGGHRGERQSEHRCGQNQGAEVDQGGAPKQGWVGERIPIRNPVQSLADAPQSRASARPKVARIWRRCSL